jgi:superoxide dismutase, Fe-Mn family
LINIAKTGEMGMATELTRRGLVGGSVAGISGLLTLASISGASAQATATSPAAFEPKPLGLDPKSIKGLSEKIIVSHYDNNYLGTVRKLNAINAELAKLDFATAPGFAINGLKREQLIASNSMILHESYFASLGQGGDPKGDIAKAINQDFGNLATWRTEFAATGKALGGGSGWVLLSYSPRLGRLVNQWAADHTTTLADGLPILALDMYEHAYHMDYGAKAAAYVDAFMAAINWEAVEGAYQMARTVTRR